jgi:hypothetical protein
MHSVVWRGCVSKRRQAPDALRSPSLLAPIHRDVEIETAIITLGCEPEGGFVVLPDVFTVAHLAPIISAASRNNVPAPRRAHGADRLMKTPRRGGRPSLNNRAGAIRRLAQDVPSGCALGAGSSSTTGLGPSAMPSPTRATTPGPFMARPSVDHQHRRQYGAGAGQVQGLLAGVKPDR